MRSASWLAAAGLVGVVVVAGLARRGDPGLPQVARPSVPAPRGFDVRRYGIVRGSVRQLHYDSRAVSGRRSVTVYLPPGYLKSASYPVLYLLHGAGDDDETAWIKKGRADNILDNLHQDGLIVPMIVVLPNGWARVPGVPGSSNALEADLLGDLIPFVDRTFATRANRENRAIAGLSMGGGQALTLGLKHLDRFAWVGGFSTSMFGKSGDLADLITEPVAMRNQLRLLWISCGDDDPQLGMSAAFHDALEAKDIPHVWHVDVGEHDWPVWRNDLYWFARRVFVRAPVVQPS
jgi:enterochelin esterase-like enzyme